MGQKAAEEFWFGPKDTIINKMLGSAIPGIRLGLFVINSTAVLGTDALCEVLWLSPIISFTLPKYLWGECHYTQLTDQETEVEQY